MITVKSGKAIEEMTEQEAGEAIVEYLRIPIDYVRFGAGGEIQIKSPYGFKAVLQNTPNGYEVTLC